MPKLTRLTRLVLPVVFLLASCEPDASPAGQAHVRAGLASGQQAAQRWIAGARSNGAMSAEQAIALGYLERQRAGAGGPFRLIEFARQDPRLSEAARRQVAWALLARTAAGTGYATAAAVLDGAVVRDSGGPRVAGEEHVRLIREAIENSPDARAGELAVRLGYALAAAEGTLVPQAPRIAARVAALERDRVLARRDALVLLDSARASGVDALALVHRWRLERRFSSEAPFLARLPGTMERQALAIAPRLAAGLRSLRITGGSADTRAAGSGAQRSLLTRAAAIALLQAADSLNLPPLAPITVAMSGYRAELEDARLPVAERAAGSALAAATTEEQLVARYALLGPAPGPLPALAVLWAAAGMRTLAQEPVWYPGWGGPSARELEQRFGLAAVTFHPSVPGEWRPYYRGLLQSAIADLQLVLPAVDVRGLRVRFDPRPRQQATLALHDPRKRQIVLPPASAAGTLAHEIAHDLDWQVALRRYHVRGDYATDRSQRAGRGRARDPLALRLQELYAAVPVPAGLSEQLAAHARRPAEIFARNIDWYVAVALARTGRMNGYLTSVQDELLTGYGTVRPPELSGSAGDALIRVLDVVAPVYPETRAWFLRNYGSGRELRSYDLARGVLETALPAMSAAPFSASRWNGDGTQRLAPGTGAFARIARARDAGLASISTWTCRLPDASYDAPLQEARQQLVLAAAAAKARGLALERVRQLGDPGAQLRLARAFYGAPYGTPTLSAEEEAYVEQLAGAVTRVEQVSLPERESGFTLAAQARAAGCLLH